MRQDKLDKTDFHAWIKAQTLALESLAATRPNAPIDWPHLIEEVAGLGKSERDTVRSHVRTILEHLLKLAHSTATEPRPGWRLGVVRTRAALDDKLTPSLPPRCRGAAFVAVRSARSAAVVSMEDHGEREAAAALPDACPWPLEIVADQSFWP